MAKEYELTLNMIQLQLENDNKDLDFSKNFNLVRIMAFSSLMPMQKSSIRSINLDNNKLDNIERIDFLTNLEFLSVNNNIIKEIHLQILSLKELRLSQNQLRQIPSLASLQNLKVLDLSHNKITSMEDKQIQELPDSIEKFYINNNQIRYKDGYGIIQTLEEFHKKGALIELNVAKNPFIIKFPFIEKTFARKLPQIDLLNGKARNFILKGEEGGEQQIDDLENLEFENSEFEDVDDNRVSYELRKRIQTCIDDPSVAVSQLKKISETVSRITQQTPQQINNCFISTSQKTQSEIEENMEVFLSASFLFAQNQPNYVEEVLKYLAQLAIVSVLQFGRRCFEVVVELIRSGSGLQKIASNILKTYSLPLLIKQETLSKVPTFVMEGILRTIQERQDYSIVNPEAVNTFVRWMDQILHTYSNDTSSIREEQEQRDILCLQFIAEMAKEKKTFWNQYREKQIITKCIQLFKMLIDTDHNEQYIATLQILNNCSKQYKHEKFVTQTHRRSTNYNVKELIDSRNTAHNFMKYLEDQLRYHLFMFKKYRNSLINPETKENKDTIMVRYRKVEILFTIYGSVCMNRIYKDETDRTQTKAEAQIVQKDFLINELLSLVIVPAIHPYLVNGLCIFARCLLYNNTVVIDDKLVKYISYKMQNCVPLLQYLGGDYYAPMMKQVEYQQSKFTKNMNAQLNPRIHKTFRNIVKLIKFFSQSALQEESPISGICLEIADSLDKNRRDEALFILLATPNDKVRLAVVQCLLTIKVSELDTREVAKLVTLIGSYKNLGAGKTETVLSHIMMILTKIVSTRESSDKEIPAAQQDFITIYGENATLDALDILIRNQERNLLDEEAENKEKLELSFGVVNFLKSLHKSEKLSRNLKGILQAKSLKKSLLDEEAYIREELLDIDIERSYIGKWSSYLFSCLFSKDSLYPYGKISDRILVRMAENLENRKEDEPEELKNGRLGGLYNFDEIQRIWLEIAHNRRKYQEQIWDAMKVLDYQNPPKSEDNKKYLDEQHNLFYQQECAVQLLGYLFGKNQSTRTMTLREHFEQMFQNKLNFDRVQNQVDGQIGDLIDDFIQFYQHGVQEKMLKIHKRDEDFDNILKNIPMPTDPMRGFLKTYSHFNPNKVILFPVKTKEDQTSVVQNALNRDEQLYGKVKQMIRPEKRIVTVCAYLRILHAQLEYSPNGIGPKVAEQLAQKVEFIKDLTLICEWADWRQGNIAAKYLRIINYILEHAESCEQKEFMNAFFMIAYALRQILDIISLKLANEDKVPIKDEDLVLIKEACECMNKVTDKIGTISYIEGIEAELNSRKELKNNDEAKNQAKFLVDAKIDEYLLQQIMPFHGFLIFIEILVWDMQQDDRLSNLKTKDKFSSKLKTDMKNNIMELMSSYMTKCKSQKHQILSAINRMQVFDKKIIRQSFLQDILDQEFLIDYGAKLRQGIIDKEYMKYAILKPPGAPLKVDFNIRCFLEYKGDLVPVALIFINGFLLVIRVEEELVRRKPKQAKIWQDDHFQVIFRVFDRLIQIQKEQIYGFFRAECPQRYYMVFTQKTMLTEPERDHTLEIFFFTFPRLHQYEEFESFLESQDPPIKLATDQLIQASIKKSLKAIEPLCMMWVCLDPKIPIMNRRDEFMRNAMLLVNDGKDLKIFRTNLEFWFFKEGFVIPTTISKRIQKHTDSVRKQMCEDGYFGTEVFNYGLDKLQKIIIDQTLNSILTLQFGAKNELNILFGCDIAREEFKRSIAKPASIEKFKRAQKKK